MRTDIRSGVAAKKKSDTISRTPTAPNVSYRKLSNKFNNITFAEDTKNLANSISIAKAAYNKYNHGEFGDSNSLVPTYLRACQAERSIKNPENV